jgi:hypothetical protein
VGSATVSVALAGVSPASLDKVPGEALLPMNRHSGTPDSSGRTELSAAPCRMNPAFRAGGGLWPLNKSNRNRPLPTLARATAIILGAGLVLARAGGTVTNCTFNDLYTALFNGGTVKLVCSGTITFPQPVPILLDTVIDGTGASAAPTLSGGSTNRLFLVGTGVHLTLLGLTLTSGYGTNGGAIYNHGTLEASNCTFANNVAAGTAGAPGTAGANSYSIGGNGGAGGAGTAGLGGAIFNAGSLSLTNCQLAGNAARGGAGGAGGASGRGTFQGGAGGEGGDGGLGYGGALYSLGLATMLQCAFSNNTATGGGGGAGGAAGTGGGPVAQLNGGAGGGASGGAVYSLGQLDLSLCTLATNSVVAGSSAEGGMEDWDGRDGRVGGLGTGGAIHNAGALSALNTTFFLNQVSGGGGGNGGNSALGAAGDAGNGGDARGGALFSTQNARLINCTFATNTTSGGTNGNAGTGLGAGNAGHAGRTLGGNVANLGGTLSLQNTILAGGGHGGNGHGPVADEGGNLSSDSSVAFPTLTSAQDTDPRLGALSTCGGATPTIALLPDSPAIDRGVSNPEATVDQCGTARPQGAAYDAGAYERVPTIISGSVWSGFTPAAGLEVSVVSTGLIQHIITDAKGAYALTNVPAGSYQIFLPLDVRAAYQPGAHLLTITGTSASVTNLDFHSARPELRVAVSTTNAAGLSLNLHGAGVPATSYQIQRSSSLGDWTAAGAVTADAAGRFLYREDVASSPAFRYYRAVAP